MSISLAGSSAQADPSVYQYMLGSTVFIARVDDQPRGSGVLVDLANRLVVTNHHVVADDDEVKVFFSACDETGQIITDRQQYLNDFVELREAGIAFVGRVLARSETADLALVQLEELPVEAQALPLADASCQPGESVHLIGNSGDTELWRYCPGHVRNVYRQSSASYVVENTCPTFGGDSGSPLVNSNGELVGIHFARARTLLKVTNGRGETEYQEGERLVSYAVDIRDVRAFLESLTGGVYQGEPAGFP
jgi:S1-C subfamily serine protease